jgi:hypothetical protein
MNGPARRRFAIFGLCLGITGCAAQKLPIEPFASDSANSGPPPAARDEIQLSVDHGPAPQSPYSKTAASAAAETPPSQAATPAQFASNSNNPPPTKTTPPRFAPKTTKADDADALARVIAELQAIGPIAPTEQARLIADLQQTDPALWPTLLQTFKAGIAYRKRESAGGTVAKTNGSAKASDIAGGNLTADDTDRAPKIAATPNRHDETPHLDTAAATIPPELLAQLKAAENGNNPFAGMPLDALAGGGLTPRNGKSASLGLPTQTILQAALAEAQRKDEEQSQRPKSKVSVAMHVEKVSDDDVEPDAEGPAKPQAKNELKRDAAASTDEVALNDWRASLKSTIAGLESETRESPRSAGEVSRHAWLRMMYLAAGRREDALKPIPGIAASEQDFWSEQIYGLATYLDTEKLTDPARRSAEARSHLAKAEKRLAEASTLAVKSLAFCTEVSSYGVYQKFKEDRFKAGQPVILYCEVENFRSEESAKGFHTALRSSYQIIDPQGRRVAENDLALTEEYCQNERRDYFIRYFISVPERIYDGKYTLQLTIVDTLSQKIGQSTIDFTVGEEKK